MLKLLPARYLLLFSYIAIHTPFLQRHRCDALPCFAASPCELSDIARIAFPPLLPFFLLPEWFAVQKTKNFTKSHNAAMSSLASRDGHPKDPAVLKIVRVVNSLRVVFLVRQGDLLSRRTLCGHQFPGNYRHFPSPRRVCGVVNLGGVVKTLRRSNFTIFAIAVVVLVRKGPLCIANANANAAMRCTKFARGWFP